MPKSPRKPTTYPDWRTRPVSWSQLSSFAYDPAQWYQKYVLNIPERETPELIFGKAFADAAEAGNPLAPLTILDEVEHGFEVETGGLKLVGFADTYGLGTPRTTYRCKIGEYKTGARAWDQKRVDEHGQITMYALMNFLQNKIKPEETDFFLEWVPTVRVDTDNGDMMGFDYTIDFASHPPEVEHFTTRRTMRDILTFGASIKKTRKEMEQYVLLRSRKG